MGFAQLTTPLKVLHQQAQVTKLAVHAMLSSFHAIPVLQVYISKMASNKCVLKLFDQAHPGIVLVHANFIHSHALTRILCLSAGRGHAKPA